MTRLATTTQMPHKTTVLVTTAHVLPMQRVDRMASTSLLETYAEGGVFGTTTYRVYVTTPNETDFVSAIAGDEINPSYLRTSTSFYQNALGGLTADMINPLFFGHLPRARV